MLGLFVVSGCKSELSLSSLTGGGTSPKQSQQGKEARSNDTSEDGSSGGPMTPAPKVGKLETGKAPPWCQGYEPSSNDSSLSWVKSYTEKEGWSSKALEYAAKAACDKPRDGDRQKLVAEWAASYKAATGATDQDFVEVMTFGIMPQELGGKLETEQCAPFKEKDESASAETITLRNATGFVLGCRRDVGEEVLWWLDKPQITEVQRVAMVSQCIQNDVVNDRDSKTRGEFAFCLTDMKKLDRATFDREIAGMKPNLYGKVNAVQSFQSAKVKSNFMLKKYEGLVGKDEDWQRLFDAHQQGWDRWMKEYEANKPSFEAIKKFDAMAMKGSKKALAGCSGDLRKLFFEHMSKKKVKKIEEATALGTDMIGYPLLVAMMRCDAAEARYLPVAAAQDLFMDQAKSHRGPRFEAYEDTMQALNDIRADKEKFPLERMYPGPPSTGRNLWYKAYEQTFNKINYDRGTGQVKNVQKKGDLVLLTFQTVKWKEDEAYDCRNTRRIYRIRDDGTLEYEQKCKSKTVTRSSTQEPVSVPSDFATGLKPGMMVELMIDSGKGGKTTKIGIPKGVWKDPNKKKFIGTYGVIW